MACTSAAFADSKKHFLVLDALRGVTALEVYSGGDHTKQMINDGCLAVDFFFMLSGYVSADAYDKPVWKWLIKKWVHLK
jgi:peptidoglycan/LPS O-acetylase OafA/YrhL